MSLFDDVQAQVQTHTRQLETKGQLVEYFRATYPARGSGSWRKQIVGKLAAITGMKPKNLERRFDPSRLNNVPRSAREKEQYKELGRLIGPVPPQHGYSVTWHGEIRISNACWPRSFGPLLIQGKEAAHLTATGDPFIILRAYFQGLDMAEGWCGSPTVTIAPAHAGQGQMHFAHEPQRSKFASVFKK